MRIAALLAILALLCSLPAGAETPENEVRAVLTTFQEALRDRNVAHVQKAVGNDVVSIQEGSRREGWEEYRDRRLVPEFAHPAPASKWEVVKLNATADMAWAYTKTTLSSPSTGDVLMWTVFVLERRGKEWKIVMVDQTSGRPLPRRGKKAHHR